MMTPNLPSVAYKVNDSTELEDLVIWAKKSCLSTYRESSAFRDGLRRILERGTTTKYFAGPLDSQDEFDPRKVAPTSLPVVIHVGLGTYSDNKAFLYLTDTTTEFHIPENFAVTGAPEKDKQRRGLIRGLADGIQNFTDCSWEFAEYGGVTTTIDDYDTFWSKYWENAFARVDYEIIGS